MSQLESTKQMFMDICKEDGEIRQISSAIYFFTSEIASLRLLSKYRWCKNAYQGYSENLKSFYFSIEIEY
jgi:hypothetical protein